MNTRIEQLRRRVQADPASIAFGQLAEECRRAGNAEEAVAICRAGLGYHPDYLSARVTLGRALIELGRLDEARAELNLVLAKAPDNLAANRGLAEVYQKRGQLPEALAQYKQALEVAKFDLDIENEVRRLESVVMPPTPKPPEPVSVEALFDFDTLIAQLGETARPVAELPQPSPAIAGTTGSIESVKLTADDGDPFSVLERQLREKELHVPQLMAEPTEEQLSDRRVLAELETWLAAVITDREKHLPA